MASVAVPGGVSAGRRAFLVVVFGWIVGFVRKRRSGSVGRPGIVTRCARFVREMVGSTVAFAAITYAMWQWSPIAGWIAVGIAVLLLDFQASNRGRRP